MNQPIQWKKVQTRLKVTPDGIVGPQTLNSLLAAIAGKKVDPEYGAPLLAAITAHDINTPQRLAAFLSQCAHESAGFSVTSENLNYSAEGLRKTFAKYFPTDAIAKLYARLPQKIANRVYSSRMGNGDEKSGDGWLYRGRSWIQLTGKTNYQGFAKWIGINLIDTAVYLACPEGAVMGAAYFWDTHNLNTLADTGDVAKVTRVINGGVNGLADRQMLYQRALTILA